MQNKCVLCVSDLSLHFSNDYLKYIKIFLWSEKQLLAGNLYDYETFTQVKSKVLKASGMQDVMKSLLPFSILSILVLKVLTYPQFNLVFFTGVWTMFSRKNALDFSDKYFLRKQVWSFKFLVNISFN